MATRMQQRRGLLSQWDGANPILNPGEIGFETDTNKFKIGDGNNHWNDLPYFLDEDALGGSLEGYIPLGLLGAADGVAQLNSSGKLVSNQIPNVDEITQDAINTALVAGTGLDKTYNDDANTITLDIDSTVATKEYADTAVSTHSSDTTSVHGITDTAELATKAFAATLLTGATKTNITITGDKDGLTITAENGVADSTTTDLAEGTNLYFTDERAQDAVGTVVGTGLTYTDSTGAISVDTTTIQAKVTGVTDTEIGYLDGVTSSIQTQINDKAPLASPTFTGTVSGVTATHVGLSNVDNTSDANKPVSTATQTALDLKAPLASPTFTGTVAGITKSMVGLGSVDNTSDSAKPVSTATQTALDLKAPLASPALTGVPTAPTAAANTNTTQVATTAYVQTEIADLIAGAPGALDTLDELALALGDDANFASTLTNNLALKAPLASPTFTGTVAGITKTMVGLSNVDNTSDAAKPVSTAQQTALDLKANLASPTFTGTATIPTLSLTNALSITNGGTGATTASTAAAALLPSQSSNSGKYLTTDGSGTLSWGTVTGYSTPTLGSTSIASGATVTTIAGLTLTAPILTGTVTASGDINLSAAGGPGSLID